MKGTLATVLLLGVGGLVSTMPATAAQSYDNCKGFIDSVPATISTQGTWCMRRDLSTSQATGYAIDVTTNNVTIDCNDFKLGGLAAGQGTRTVGINALGRSNITVRNCGIRGFLKGVVVNNGDGGGHLVENNRFDNNTWLGIDIGGEGSVVRGNRILDTGGAPGIGNPIKAVGIYATGNVEVLSNLINGVVAAPGSDGFAIGINPGNSSAGTIIGNNVKNVVADGAGWAYGISMFGSIGRASVEQNTLIGVDAANSAAIWCPATNLVSLTGNLVMGFAMPNVDCAYDDGNIVH
jgi:hypothetical protein